METEPASPADASEESGQESGARNQETGSAGAEQVINGTPEEQLARAKEDAQKYLANWQRAEADFSNYKKRTEQERDELRRFGNVSLIINLLPVIDDFERGFNSLDSRLAGLTWFDGMFLIYRKLQQLLENSGVRPIEADGQAFDPRYHEAVAHVDGEDGKVLSVVQRGYKLHDRVLRPAMVVVGKGSPSGQEPGARSQEPDKEEGDGQPA